MPDPALRDAPAGDHRGQLDELSDTDLLAAAERTIDALAARFGPDADHDNDDLADSVQRAVTEFHAAAAEIGDHVRAGLRCVTCGAPIERDNAVEADHPECFPCQGAPEL